MKHRKILWTVIGLGLVAAVVVTIVLIAGIGLKTIDNEYLYTLKGEWEGTKDFSEGLAAVKKDGKWGFIDTEGNVVIEPQYDGANSFSEGLAAVQSGGKWGYIDKTGNLVIGFTLQSTVAFSEGLAIYGSGYYYGYIDTTGKIVTEAIYTEASSFQAGVACVKQNNRYGFIDKTGTPVTEFVYGGKSQADEGLIPVYYGDTAKGINSGFIDTSGNQVLDFLWFDVRPFSEGLAAVQTEYTKPWGFINSEGVFVIDPAWDGVEPFCQGRALVMKNNSYTYIDSEGNPITDKTFAKAYSFTEDGVARIGNSTGVSWLFGYINLDGSERIAPKYAAAMDFHYGYAAVGNGKKWGFIDKNGTELSGYLWTDVGDFTEEGIARVRSGKYYGFVKLK